MLGGLFSLPTQSSYPSKVFGFNFYEKWNPLYCPMKVHATYWGQRFQNYVSIFFNK